NPYGERGLTWEPLYVGEPILAVAAVDEYTAAEAIEKIKVHYETLPHVVDPLVSLRPGSPNARLQGNVWTRPAPGPPNKQGSTAPPEPPEIKEWKWTDEEFNEYEQGRLPMGKATDTWEFGDVD